MSTSFMHIGMTVTDIDIMSDFYIKYLGFKKGYGRVFDEDFVSKFADLYREPEGVYTDMQMLESEDGIVVELFKFSNLEHEGTAKWHKTGYHHLAFKVDNVPELYERMKADGIEFFLVPEKRDDGDGYWTFFKDPDGNMLELWD